MRRRRGGDEAGMICSRFTAVSYVKRPRPCGHSTYYRSTWTQPVPMPFHSATCSAAVAAPAWSCISHGRKATPFRANASTVCSDVSHLHSLPRRRLGLHHCRYVLALAVTQSVKLVRNHLMH
eukprot:6213109-Pleurochrysis_carterae.AAC.3